VGEDEGKDQDQNQDQDQGESEGLAEVWDQAAELGRLLSLPVIYAAAPDPRAYAAGPAELHALSARPGPSLGLGLGLASRGKGRDGDGDGLGLDFYDGWLLGEGDENEDKGEGEGEGESAGEGKSAPVQSATDPKQEQEQEQQPQLVALLDYTDLAPWVWVDGISDPRSGAFFPGRAPLLSKRSAHGAAGAGAGAGTAGGAVLGAGRGAVCVGVRVAGALELVQQGSEWRCTPVQTQTRTQTQTQTQAQAQAQSRARTAAAAAAESEDAVFRDGLAALAQAAGPMLRRGSSAGTGTGASTITTTMVTSAAGAGASGPSQQQPQQPQQPQPQSLAARLIARNQFLADRTRRQLRPSRPGDAKSDTKSDDQGKGKGGVEEGGAFPAGGRGRPAVMVNAAGEVVRQETDTDRFAGEKDPAIMPIFDDDADDLFG